jgi:prepilin-type N-terminal cleavage/methylation domain-containing protein
MTRTQQQHEGFSLIELLLVVVVLGILAAVVVASVGGLSDAAKESGCASDSYVLQTAIEAYFAQNETQVIPSADATSDSYENSLVDAGFLRFPSEWHNIDSSGKLDPSANSPCQR